MPRSKLGTDCSAPSMTWNVPRPDMRQLANDLPSNRVNTVPGGGGVVGGGYCTKRRKGWLASPSGTRRRARRRRIATPFITGFAEPQVGSTEASPAYKLVTK